MTAETRRALEQRVWTVPAGRMKMGREHRVPLSEAAVAILEGIERRGEYVFPARHGGKMPRAAPLLMVKPLCPDATLTVTVSF